MAAEFNKPCSSSCAHTALEHEAHADGFAAGARTSIDVEVDVADVPERLREVADAWLRAHAMGQVLAATCRG